MKRKYSTILIGFLVLANIFSCKKLVQVDTPITSVNEKLVYTNDAQAIAVLTGLYTKMSTAGLSYSEGASSTSLTGSLSSDDLIPINSNNQTRNEYFSNSLTPLTPTAWADIYNKIYVVNAALEGISKSSALTPSIKQQLIGEAKFMRAFNYFYLVNLYGDVPFPLSTDYKINSQLGRTSAQIVYEQIVMDLKEAQAELSEDYLSSNLSTTTMERVRPTKAAATALLARVYLYTKAYLNAEIEASKVINNTSRFSLVTVDEVFKKNNKEAIWQIMPVGIPESFTANTKEGLAFVPISSLDDYALSNSLISAFEMGDKRRTNWIGIFDGKPFPNKYKIGRINSESQEYSTVLRLAELLLIRAESRAQQNNIVGAIEDLNLIRKRARSEVTLSVPNPLPDLSLNLDKSSVLSAIARERQVELFTEWGHRWFDLKRTDRATSVLSAINGKNWQVTDELYPIPQTEIDLAPNLREHQNPGY